MKSIPIPEIQADLDATDKDLIHLDLIVTNLRCFIYETDQTRHRYRIELLTFETLQQQAITLRAKIATALESQRAALRTAAPDTAPDKPSQQKD